MKIVPIGTMAKVVSISTHIGDVVYDPKAWGEALLSGDKAAMEAENRLVQVLHAISSTMGPTWSCVSSCMYGWRTRKPTGRTAYRKNRLPDEALVRLRDERFAEELLQGMDRRQILRDLYDLGLLEYWRRKRLGRKRDFPYVTLTDFGAEVAEAIG